MPVWNHPLSKTASRRLELRKWLGALGLLALAAASAVQAQGVPSGSPAGGVVVPEPASAGVDVVEIHPFRLREGYRHDWLASRPLVTSGLLVVLKVNREYVSPRNAAEPVLYAGDRTVQRLNQGYQSGYVIGIVPGPLDLASALVFFGRPQLPERVTPEIIAAERALAVSAGITAFSREQVERVWGDALDVEDLSALLREGAADLVRKYARDENDLAETWRGSGAGPIR